MSNLWASDLSFPDHSYAWAGEGVWGETRDLWSLDSWETIIRASLHITAVEQSANLQLSWGNTLIQFSGFTRHHP